jgi:cytochrome c oxidase subunit 3
LEFEELSQMSVTATSGARVAHHFDDPQQQYQAASLGMWLFLATEILFFGGLFAGYTQYRSWHPAEFAVGSHHLDVWLGAANTAVLLTSSLTMALAVLAAQTSDRDATVRFLVLTMILGGAFLGVKAYEYHHKYVQHLVPGAAFEMPASHDSASSQIPVGDVAAGPVEIFFSFYFAMTGLHALHMVIGIAILGWLTLQSSRGAFSADYFTPIELTGLYWHFVDIVWVFLYPLLYLIR